MSQALTESPESLQALAGIIESSRRRANATRLSEENLRDEIRDWLAICQEIPGYRLRDCYIEAYRRREVKSALQPRELITAWQAIRERERIHSSPEPVTDFNESVCFYCNGTGWQAYLMLSQSGALNEYSRGCACSKAPPSMRKDLPLREPHWRKRLNGVWERV